MDAPAEFSQGNGLYADLQENGSMAFTTLDLLDSDFDAGDFLPRLREALPSMDVVDEDPEQHLHSSIKAPRAFQMGLVKVRSRFTVI